MRTFIRFTLWIAITICGEIIVNAQTPLLWGVSTMGGGPSGGGTLFHINGDGSNFTVAHVFDITYPGYWPYAPPIFANGKIYATTIDGGDNASGNLFSYDTLTGTFTDLYDFSNYDSTSNGPYGIIQASDGKLYGATWGFNNASNNGVIFSFDPVNNVYSKLYAFDSTDGKTGGNLVEVTPGVLYGYRWGFKSNNGSVIFSYTIATHQYEIVDTLPLNYPIVPYSSMAVDPVTHLLYGYCGEYGSMFTLNLSTRALTYLNPFALANHIPCGTFVITGNEMMYGICQRAIYKYNITTGALTILDSLPDGAWSHGGVARGANGKLYGTAYAHLTNSTASLFSIDTATDHLTYLYNMPTSQGFSAIAPLPLPGGSIYLMNLTTPTDVAGNFCKYDLNTDSFTVLGWFNQSLTANRPLTSVVQASNGVIYGTAGTTQNVGPYTLNGSIFSYNPCTQQFAFIYNFNDTTGKLPTNDRLVQAANGYIFGVNGNGGLNNLGVIYRLNPTNNQVIAAHTFDSTSGYLPNAGIIYNPNDGLLYGTTTHGGAHGTGAVFSLNPSSNQYTVLSSFNTTNGKTPAAPLAVAANGKMYSVTFSGGPTGSGVLYEFDPVTDSITMKLDIHNISGGVSKYNALAASGTGKLYGAGGESIFCFDPATDSAYQLISFADTLSAIYNIWGGVVFGGDGKLYGTAAGNTLQSGYNGGSIFSFDTTNNTFAILKFLSLTSGVNNGGDILTGLTSASLIGGSYDTISAGFCQGGVYNFNGHLLSSAGVYHDTLNTGCNSYQTLFLTVDSLPVVTWPGSPDTVLAGSITLNGGLPAGGTYTGAGVTGNTFSANAAGPGSHIITYHYSNVNNCADSAVKTIVVLITGINEIDMAGQLSIFPNPAGDYIVAQSALFTGSETRPQVYDVTGRQVNMEVQINADKIVFNTSALSTGVYWIRFNLNGVSVNKQFVKVE